MRSKYLKSSSLFTKMRVRPADFKFVYQTERVHSADYEFVYKTEIAHSTDFELFIKLRQFIKNILSS